MKQLLFAADNQIASAARLCLAEHVGIELQAFHDPRLPERDPETIERHEAAIAKITVRALHGPYIDLCPGSFDPMVRDVTRERFEQGYRIAERLEIDHLVFHHGFVPGNSQKQGWLRRSCSFWREFLADKPIDVRFHIENQLDREPEPLAELVAAIDDKRVDICLDLGHVHCHSSLGILQWIERLGSLVGQAHLHDNHGVEDEYLGLGEGTIPLAEACEALNHHAPSAIWTLEVPPESLSSSLGWLRERGLCR